MRLQREKIRRNTKRAAKKTRYENADPKGKGKRYTEKKQDVDKK